MNMNSPANNITRASPYVSRVNPLTTSDLNIVRDPQDDLSHSLHTYFESRLGGLKHTLINLCEKLESDEIISTLKQDPTSAVHVHKRVEEILTKFLDIETNRHHQQLLSALQHRERELAESHKELALLKQQLLLSGSSSLQALPSSSREVELSQQLQVLQHSQHEKDTERQVLLEHISEAADDLSRLNEALSHERQNVKSVFQFISRFQKKEVDSSVWSNLRTEITQLKMFSKQELDSLYGWFRNNIALLAKQFSQQQQHTRAELTKKIEDERKKLVELQSQYELDGLVTSNSEAASSPSFLNSEETENNEILCLKQKVKMEKEANAQHRVVQDQLQRQAQRAFEHGEQNEAAFHAMTRKWEEAVKEKVKIIEETNAQQEASKNKYEKELENLRSKNMELKERKGTEIQSLIGQKDNLQEQLKKQEKQHSLEIQKLMAEWQESKRKILLSREQTAEETAQINLDLKEMIQKENMKNSELIKQLDDLHEKQQKGGMDDTKVIQLVSELSNAKEQIARLNQEHLDAKEQTERLKQENGELIDKLKNMLEENLNLKAKKDETKEVQLSNEEISLAKIARLKQENVELLDERKKLITESADIVAENANLKAKIKQLSKVGNSSNNQVDSLSQEVSELKKRLEEKVIVENQLLHTLRGTLSQDQEADFDSIQNLPAELGRRFNSLNHTLNKVNLENKRLAGKLNELKEENQNLKEEHHTTQFLKEENDERLLNIQKKAQFLQVENEQLREEQQKAQLVTKGREEIKAKQIELEKINKQIRDDALKNQNTLKQELDKTRMKYEKELMNLRSKTQDWLKKFVADLKSLGISIPSISPSDFDIDNLSLIILPHLKTYRNKSLARQRAFVRKHIERILEAVNSQIPLDPSLISQLLEELDNSLSDGSELDQISAKFYKYVYALQAKLREFVEKIQEQTKETFRKPSIPLMDEKNYIIREKENRLSDQDALVKELDNSNRQKNTKNRELLDKLKHQEEKLKRQENRKKLFLERVRAKDAEINELHKALSESMKKMSVEGVLAASHISYDSSKKKKY